MNKNTKRDDSLIGFDDVEDLGRRIDKGDEFKRMIFELCAREPELAIAVAHRFASLVTLLEYFKLTARQRQAATEQLTFLTWSPLLLLDQAHRRTWDDFLPALDGKGGGK